MLCLQLTDCHSYNTCKRTVWVFNTVFCSLPTNTVNAVRLALNQGTEATQHSDMLLQSLQQIHRTSSWIAWR